MPGGLGHPPDPHTKGTSWFADRRPPALHQIGSWAPALPALAGSHAEAAAPCWSQGSILGSLSPRNRSYKANQPPYVFEWDSNNLRF